MRDASVMYEDLQRGEAMTDSDFRLLMEDSPEQAHRKLFDDYCGYVYAICANKLKSCGSAEDIEECVSEAFAAVFRYLDSHKDMDGELKGIIGTIARRTAIDSFRLLSKRYGTTVSIDSGNISELASGQRVDAETERAALRETVLGCIEELGEPDSSIIVYHYFYGKTAKQTGKLLGLGAEAVQKRLSRARIKLKEILRSHGITEEDEL